MIPPSTQIVRNAVREAVKSGRSFHDYWYYTMSFTDHALFAGKQEFESRADAAYREELTRLDRDDAVRSAATEAYWQAKQGEDYGSY